MGKKKWRVVHIQKERSVWAGVLIGIGGCANLYSPIKLLGAVLFSIGLIAVIIENCSLYTGKIGFIRHNSELLILAERLICLINIKAFWW